MNLAQLIWLSVKFFSFGHAHLVDKEMLTAGTRCVEAARMSNTDCHRCCQSRLSTQRLLYTCHSGIFWHPTLIQFTTQTHIRGCHISSQLRGSFIKKGTVEAVEEYAHVLLVVEKILDLGGIYRRLSLQNRRTGVISNSFKVLLTKALRLQELIKTIWLLLLLFREE